ncbi:MAG TPA: L-threonylcarbamoyladenylate synthase [Terriglobia bacterium]|nr:L-threonylcarbamoyladenylate synthase [Terriglobia bacterium]
MKIGNSNLEFVLEYSTRLLLAGRVVSFPTDTYYALGADPLNLAAINEVFRLKRRASGRPLPLLVASIDQAADLTDDPPRLFFRLAEKFWPGPLTIVVPASRQLPLKVTANTGKVGLRWPKNPLAVALIAAAGRPLTGTSANITENPPCNTADEVNQQLGQNLPLIIDGGTAKGGLASTVVELIEDGGRIVRHGPVTESDLKEFFG